MCTLEEAVTSVSTVVVLEVICWLHTVPVRPLAFKQLQMRVRWMGRMVESRRKVWKIAAQLCFSMVTHWLLAVAAATTSFQ